MNAEEEGREPAEDRNEVEATREEPAQKGQELEMQTLLMPLAVPVPPMLEEALGYEGKSRLVAFYWTRNGDELMCEDGHWSSSAQETAWGTYTEHALVAPALNDLHFGGEGRPAEFYLVLDRQERQVYAGEMLPVLRLLAAQHLAPPSDQDIADQLRQGVHLMEREADSHPPPRMVEAWRQAQLRLEDEMLNWLDQWAVDRPNQAGQEDHQANHQERQGGQAEQPGEVTP